MDEMSTRQMQAAIRSHLLQLASHEDDLAAFEAAATPYWATHPVSVIGRRAAARVLRAQADQLLPAS